MAQATGPTLALGLTVVLTAALLSACTSAPQVEPEPQPASAPPVAVVRSSLTSVITMDATISQGVVVHVAATKPGRFVPAVGEGATVAAGAAVGDLAGTRVVTPTGGKVTRTFAGLADRNATLVAIEADGLVVTGSAPFAARYRVGDTVPTRGRVQIMGGPGPTDCTVLGAPVIADTKITFACRLSRVTQYPGVPAVLAVELATKANVPTLPLSAVAGAAEFGEVNRVLPGGGTEVVRVGLGLTDGARVEVTSGLAEGDQVAATPPIIKVR